MFASPDVSGTYGAAFCTNGGTMKIDLERWVAGGVLALACMVGPGTAQAANIIASETGAEVGTLVGTQFDVSPFAVTSSGPEFADGGGAFIANSTANGMAL